MPEETFRCRYCKRKFVVDSDEALERCPKERDNNMHRD